MTDRTTASGSSKASWFSSTPDRQPMLMRLLLPSLLFPTVLWMALLLALTACEPNPATDPPAQHPRLDVSGIDTMQTRIVIEKSKYRLHLYEGDSLLRSYPVVLGGDPVTDKHQEGDSRTPEGLFHVRTKYDHAKWSKFIWVDYPTEESYRRFEARKAAGKIAQDASIGGEIGIHGVPEGRDDLIRNGHNWTLGCISLTRADVDELYALIRTGTEIRILH